MMTMMMTPHRTGSCQTLKNMLSLFSQLTRSDVTAVSERLGYTQKAREESVETPPSEAKTTGLTGPQQVTSRCKE